MMGVTSGAGMFNPCGTSQFTAIFLWVVVAQSLVFCVVFCWSKQSHVTFIKTSYFPLNNIVFPSQQYRYYKHTKKKSLKIPKALSEESCESKMTRQYNGQKKRKKGTNNNLQNTTQKTKD
jgi:hypothetical protein